MGAWRQLQSLPRRRFGVPVGGPWDREAAQLALALLKEQGEGRVFEILHGTVEARIDGLGTISVVGTDGRVTVSGRVSPLGVRRPVGLGDIVCVQARCAYLAWSPVRLNQAKLDWKSKSVQTLRYLPSQAEGLEYEVSVSPASSRAGVRLIGLPPGNGGERPSEPCCVGAIQQTPGGELLIIGPDGPTIGGYPRLGTVIEADLNRVPRLSPAQKINIIPVSLEVALTNGTAARDRSFQLCRTLLADTS